MSGPLLPVLPHLTLVHLYRIVTPNNLPQAFVFFTVSSVWKALCQTSAMLALDLSAYISVIHDAFLDHSV